MLLVGLAMVALGLFCLDRDESRSGWFGGHHCWHHSEWDDYGQIVYGVILIGVVAVTVLQNFHFSNPFASAPAAVATPAPSRASTKSSARPSAPEKAARATQQKGAHRAKSGKAHNGNVQ